MNPPESLQRVVSRIHQDLKVGPGDADGAAPGEIETARARPVVKSFPGTELVSLPRDFRALDMSMAAVCEQRASINSFTAEPLTGDELSTFLYYSYGVKGFTSTYNTKRFPRRMAPSAGGLQPIDLYLVINRVAGICRGLHYYDPVAHGLRLLDQGDMRYKAMHCCINQEWVADAAVLCILVADIGRSLWKYGRRSYRFVHIDTGVLAENMYMVGTAMGLGTCAISGYYDDMVNELVQVDGSEELATLLFATGKRCPKTSPRETLL
jgi:SagB-type dehydrogenase family enzyme